MSVIDVNGLGKRFGARAAVEGLSFSVEAGEVFGLLGPNGAGKTTTVRMLTGLLRPSEGSAQVCGHVLGGDDEALRRKVGLLTEQPGLYDRLTARENLRFFMQLHELDERKTWVLAQHLLERFGLWGREDDACGTYSKGMRQKLALVRTLLHSPELVFLDEPTSGLDPESARTVRDVIAELGSEKRTIVLCSHNLAEVERLCGRIAIVKGHLRALGTLTQLRGADDRVDVVVQGQGQPFVAALSALPECHDVAATEDHISFGVRSPPVVADAVTHLVARGARICSVTPRRRSLEDVYLELVR